MPLLNIIRQFNWVDILVIILLFRICYIAFKNGLLVDFFKLLGTISSIYLSLHYYTFLSDWFSKRFPVVPEKTPLEFVDFICFLVLAIVGYLIFVLLRGVFYRFLKVEAVPRLNKGGGLILGMVRAYLLMGLLTFMLVISSIGYLKNSVRDSYSGRRLFRIAPKTYSWLWNNLTSKFMTGEKFNKTILEVQEDFSQR